MSNAHVPDSTHRRGKSETFGPETTLTIVGEKLQSLPSRSAMRRDSDTGYSLHSNILSSFCKLAGGLMAFPTKNNLALSSTGGLPKISFSVIGNQIDPTTYVVGVSKDKVQPGGETSVKYIGLIKSTDLDTAKEIKGQTVQQVQDLDGRALKWTIGLSSLDQLDADFRMQVKCGQGDPLSKTVDEPGKLDHGVAIANGYIFVTVS